MTHSEVVWEIPEPLSTLEVPVDDESAVILRRHGNPAGPRLVLSHGNGLAIDLYYPFWSLLTDEFDVIVYDLRNHGWNKLGAIDNHNLPTLVSDHDKIIEAIDSQYGQKSTAGVFHSISALTTLLSPMRGERYSALILFDPPLCKAGDSYEEFDAAATRLAAVTRRRTFHFETRESLAELLSFLPTFERTVPGFYDLFARATLSESAKGTGYELRCPPEYEARLVDYARAFAVLVDFGSLRCPTKVIGADPTLPYSYLPTLDLSDIMSVNYDFLPEATHLLQIEAPEECVATMREFLDPIVRI